MSLGKNIRSGVAWLMLGNTGSQVLQFLFGIALARLLTPADFGIFATTQILTGMLLMASSGGMGQSLIRAKRADASDFCSVFTIQLALGLAICGGIFIIAPWFARFFDDPLYTGLLGVSALNFLLRPFAFTRSAWLNREMRFERVAIVNLSATLVSCLTGVALALAGLGVWSLAFSGLIASLLSNLMLYWFTPLRLVLHFDAAVIRRHSAFGFNITALDFISHARDQGVSLIFSKLSGPEFLGLFNKAEGLARMPNRMLTPAVGQVVFRALSKTADNVDQSKYIMYRAITLLSVYVFPFLVGFLWIAEPFIAVLYGQRWLPAAEPARIMALAGFFLTSLRPFARLLEAQNRLPREMLVEAVVSITLVAACLLGLRWGLDGVAWAVFCVHVFHTLLMYWAVSRTICTRIGDWGRALFPASLLSIVLAAALALLNCQIEHLRTSAPSLYLIAMAVAGFLVYTVSFLYLPIPALRSEADRWRTRVSSVLLAITSRSR